MNILMGFTTDRLSKEMDLNKSYQEEISLIAAYRNNTLSKIVKLLNPA